MKKIGILFGMEETFPPAFVERVNSKKEKDILPSMYRSTRFSRVCPVVML